MRVSEILYEKDGNKFREEALNLKRSRSKFPHYFSCNNRELGQGKSGIFVDAKLANKLTKDLCHKLLAMFGYSEKDLQIE